MKQNRQSRNKATLGIIYDKRGKNIKWERTVSSVCAEKTNSCKQNNEVEPIMHHQKISSKWIRLEHSPEITKLLKKLN